MSSVPTARLARPILVFGGTGQVGRELLPALASIGQVVAPSRTDADLAQSDMLRAAIRHVRPSVVDNAAALTNVDRAEQEPDLAHQLNDVAPRVMAEEARDAGAVMVHYSTDYVFDGARDTPYEECDEPNPINIYGATKLAGERSVAAAGGPHLVIRTSWVYSRTGAGFVPTLLRQLRTPGDIRVVADQTGSPTWSRSLALATTAMLRALISAGQARLPDEWSGVYHLGGAGSASRVEIARHLIAIEREFSPADPGGPQLVVPVTASEFGALAPRPSYSALANVRALRHFGVTLDPWRTELRRMLAEAR